MSEKRKVAGKAGFHTEWLQGFQSAHRQARAGLRHQPPEAAVSTRQDLLGRAVPLKGERSNVRTVSGSVQKVSQDISLKFIMEFLKFYPAEKFTISLKFIFSINCRSHSKGNQVR